MLQENPHHWAAPVLCCRRGKRKKSASQALLLALSSSNIRSLLIKNRQLFGSSFDVCAYSLRNPPTTTTTTMSDNAGGRLFSSNRPPPPSPSWSNLAGHRHDLWGTWHHLLSGRLIFQKMRTNGIEWTANIINGDHDRAEIVRPLTPFMHLADVK